MHTNNGDLIRSKLGFLDVMGSSQHQETLGDMTCKIMKQSLENDAQNTNKKLNVASKVSMMS